MDGELDETVDGFRQLVTRVSNHLGNSNKNEIWSSGPVSVNWPMKINSERSNSPELAQGEKDNLIAVVLAKVEDGKVKRLDLCGAPLPHSVSQTGEYPGRKVV